uniref:Uncharacterized protein n=1 Tax=Tetranychus urticae TaxID=32264 RepID=T1KNC7_TETUR
MTMINIHTVEMACRTKDTTDLPTKTVSLEACSASESTAAYFWNPLECLTSKERDQKIRDQHSQWTTQQLTMDNLVPILLYIRNFREYRHRDCRDGSPRFVGRESSRRRARNRSSVSTSSPSSSSFSSTATGNNSVGRSPSFRYKMQQVGEEIKELEKETSPEIERSSRVDIKSPSVNHIDSTSSDHQLEDQDYDDYSKLTSLEDEELTENFQVTVYIKSL